jgi:hypothetical protein
MSNQFYNLNYSPTAQGFDAGTWRTLYGDVAVVSNQLQLTKAAIIHYGDILRGDAVFNINIAAPFASGDSKFGFIQYSKNEYAYFKISGPVLTAETSDGVTAYSVPITWESQWTDTNTEFRIKWESGSVRFYVGGQLLVTIGESSLLNVPVSVVPNDPMSLFIASDSTDLFLLNYITVVGIQSYLMSEGNDNSVFEPFVKESDRISISESVTVAHAAAADVNIVDSINITENNTQTIDYTHPSGLISTLSITEGVTVGSPA